MRRLAILLLLAPSLLAQQPARETFPNDYKPASCADVSIVCKSFPQSQMAEIAALRGWDIGQEWIDAHWNELMTGMKPICAKIATCFSTPGNDYLFCNDVVLDETLALCNRYPEGSTDRTKCGWFLNTFMVGHDRNSRGEWEKMQACATQQKPSEPVKEKTFDAWIVPEKFGPDYNGRFTIYAIDSETHVPVQALLTIQSKKPIYSEDVPNGQPTANYPVKWMPKLWRVTNKDGHSDVAPPQVRIEKEGYRTVTMSLPIDIPSMKVEMNPPAAKLKAGRNTVTIKATDASTGAPIEARVMGGASVLGKTNEPFELEIAKGTKRPEIWVTSLYDRYSDVVVAPAEK